MALSQKLNSKLEPKQQKEWFKIFKKMDEDGSGRITYEEFKDYAQHGKVQGPRVRHHHRHRTLALARLRR